jgi:hypothetical protein
MNSRISVTRISSPISVTVPDIEGMEALSSPLCRAGGGQGKWAKNKKRTYFSSIFLC